MAKPKPLREGGIYLMGRGAAEAEARRLCMSAFETKQHNTELTKALDMISREKERC